MKKGYKKILLSIIFLIIITIITIIILLSKQNKLFKKINYRIKNGIFAEEEQPLSQQISMDYKIASKPDEERNIDIVLEIRDETNGIDTIEFDDDFVIYGNGKKRIEKDKKIKLGQEYKIKITSTDGRIEDKILLIEEYYCNVEFDLREGIIVSNNEKKIPYKQSYQTRLTVPEGYEIDTVKVTMGSEEISVDESTYEIYIEEVTDDIIIKANMIKVNLEEASLNDLVDYSTGHNSNSQKNLFDNDNNTVYNFGRYSGSIVVYFKEPTYVCGFAIDTAFNPASTCSISVYNEENNSIGTYYQSRAISTGKMQFRITEGYYNSITLNLSSPQSWTCLREIRILQ